MTVIAEILAGVLAAGLILLLFVKANPTTLASMARTAGPVALAAVGALLIGLGQGGLGGLLCVFALGWYGLTGLSRRKPEPPPRRAMVRTAALEMELDQESGALEGLVLAGRSEGRVLGSMGQAELVALYRELGADPESRQLLEAYLDSRFPVWRKNAKADRNRRLSRAPGSGPMTKEEAYKILGLEAGAAASDVRKAHRRLLQRLDTEVGRTSFLAARINEAKDVLLSDHN